MREDEEWRIIEQIEKDRLWQQVLQPLTTQAEFERFLRETKSLSEEELDRELDALEALVGQDRSHEEAELVRLTGKLEAVDTQKLEVRGSDGSAAAESSRESVRLLLEQIDDLILDSGRFPLILSV